MLVDGEFEPFSFGEDVFGFWRTGAEESVCVLVNASLSEAHDVKVPMVGDLVTDVVSGRAPKVEGGQASTFLWPLGTSVLHFHRARRLQLPLDRGMGATSPRSPTAASRAPSAPPPAASLTGSPTMARATGRSSP